MLPNKNQIGLNLADNKVALAVKIHTFCLQQYCAQQDWTSALSTGSTTTNPRGFEVALQWAKAD